MTVKELPNGFCMRPLELLHFWVNTTVWWGWVTRRHLNAGSIEDQGHLADHARAVAFAIADGQLPSNNGAGYVIRRILRRAIRYGFTFLQTKEPFIYQLVSVLSEQLGAAFPELKSQKTLIVNVIKEEEISFLKTLEQGLLLLDEVIEQTNENTISGKKAFELYDTFGFPIDLTALMDHY
mgnify:CR=1 FL=1